MECFKNLPSEILEIILSFLKPGDVHSLSQAVDDANTNYPGIYYHNRKVLDLSLDFRIKIQVFKKIIKHASTLAKIENLNINGLYWIPVTEIKIAIQKLKNLQTIYAIDTKYSVHIKSGRFVNHSTKPYLIKSLDNKIRGEDLYLTEKTLRIGGKLLQKYPGEMLEPSTLPSWVIEDKSWINFFFRFDTDDIATLDQHPTPVGMVQLSYEDIFVQSVDSLLKQKENVKMLSIKNLKNHIDKDVVNLDFINDLNNLEKLHIDVINFIPPTFLTTVFSQCPNLKSIRIYNWSTRYKLSNMKFANAKLEDFSYICNDVFQVDKFFIELNNNHNLKLKRIFLQCKSKSLFSNASVIQYLTNNPQLIYFGVRCDMAKVVLNKLQQTLNNFKVSTQQYFNIYENDNAIFNTPLIHFDMLYLKAEVKSGNVRCYFPRM